MAGRWVDLREAAQELGTSTEAVRKRAARGTLESRKGEDGKVYVRVDTDRPGVHPSDPQAQVGANERVEDLREQVAYLREQLEAERKARAEESRELRRLLAGLIERVPQLEPPGEPQGGQESRREPGGEDDTQEEAPSRPGEGDSAPLWHAGTDTAPEEPPRQPWWRRWFG